MRQRIVYFDSNVTELEILRNLNKHKYIIVPPKILPKIVGHLQLIAVIILKLDMRQRAECQRVFTCSDCSCIRLFLDTGTA